MLLNVSGILFPCFAIGLFPVDNQLTQKQAIVKIIEQAQKILAEIMQMCREHEHTMRICVGDPETFAPW